MTYEFSTWSAMVDESTTGINGDDSLYFRMSREEAIKIIYICVSVFGIPGNLLTLLAILTSPRMKKKPFNLLLVNQSVIDLCYCICGVLNQVIQPEFPPNRNGILICKIWSSTYIFWALTSNSNYNLVIIAIERFLATLNPLKYDEERVLHRIPYVVAFVWISGFIVALPNLIPAYPISNTECILFLALSNVEQLMIRLWFTTCLVIVPLVTMVYCYGRIIYYIYRQSKSEPITSGTGRVSLRKAQMHIMQTAITVSLIFIVVYTYNIITIYGLVFYNIPHFPYYHIGVYLIMFNSSINPYVYCIRYDDFQQRILEICRNTKKMCCLFCKQMCL